jgi:Holliday junction resolvasome RuvABC endonuclease subunit
MVTYTFGLDMSVTSPAMSMYNATTSQLEMVCFAQRKREAGLTVRGDNWSVRALEECAKGAIDVVRYKHIIDNFIVNMLAFCNGDCKGSIVRIEQYAFGSSGAHVFKLQELGGCLKLALYEAGFLTIELIAIGSWKKRFTGKGNATKSEVYNAMVVIHKLPALLPHFQLLLSKNGDPPSPVNDICDAVGIMGIHTVLSGTKRKLDSTENFILFN